LLLNSGCSQIGTDYLAVFERWSKAKVNSMHVRARQEGETMRLVSIAMRELVRDRKIIRARKTYTEGPRTGRRVNDASIHPENPYPCWTRTINHIDAVRHDGKAAAFATGGIAGTFDEFGTRPLMRRCSREGWRLPTLAGFVSLDQLEIGQRVSSTRYRACGDGLSANYRPEDRALIFER